MQRALRTEGVNLIEYVMIGAFLVVSVAAALPGFAENVSTLVAKVSTKVSVLTSRS